MHDGLLHSKSIRGLTMHTVHYMRLQCLAVRLISSSVHAASLAQDQLADECKVGPPGHQTSCCPSQHDLIIS